MTHTTTTRHPIERPIEGRVPVSRPDEEQIVIGYLMDQRTTSESEAWMARLHADCFYDPKLRRCFCAMNDLLSEGLPTDVINVWARLDQMQNADDRVRIELYELIDWTNRAKTHEISPLVELLQQYRVRRTLQQLGQGLTLAAETPTDSVPDMVNSALRTLELQDVAQNHRGRSLSEVIPELQERLADNQDDTRRHHGPLTGIRQIDSQNCIPETGLMVLAGGTSQGKSSLALAIAMQSARAGMHSAYFSLEMTDQQLLSRITATLGQHLSSSHLMNDRLSPTEHAQALSDLQQVDQTFGQLIHLDDSRSTQLDDICAGIRYMHQTYGIRIAIIDYLQQLNFTAAQQPRNVTTEQQTGFAARCLKNLGDRLGICVIALSQINRSLDRQRPWLSALRDSGQIAEAADLVMLCWRPEFYNGQYDASLEQWSPRGTMALLIAKNRMGPIMDVMVKWNQQWTEVRDLTDRERHQLCSSRDTRTPREYVLGL